MLRKFINHLLCKKKVKQLFNDSVKEEMDVNEFRQLLNCRNH